eukprot:Nk52_evm1s1591 gene=Nk52_evmTU1s1591
MMGLHANTATAPGCLPALHVKQRSAFSSFGCSGATDTYVFEMASFQGAAGTLLAASASDNTIKIFDKTRGLLRTQSHNPVLGQLQHHQDQISNICFSKQSPHLLFSSSLDRTVAVWDVRTPTAPVSCYSFTPPTPSSPQLPPSSSHHRHRHSPATKAPTPSRWCAVDVCPADTILAAGTEKCGEDALLVFWDMRNGSSSGNGSAALGMFEEAHSDDITQVKFNPTKRAEVASGSTDGLVCVFDLTNGGGDSGHNGVCLNEEENMVGVLNSESSVSKIGFFGGSVTANGTCTTHDYIYCISHTSAFNIWNAQTSAQLAAIPPAACFMALPSLDGNVDEDAVAHYDYLVDCFFDPLVGRLYAVGGFYNGDATLLHVNRERFTKVRDLKGGHTDTVRCFDWTSGAAPSPSMLFTGGEDNCLTLWTDEPAAEFSKQAVNPSPKAVPASAASMLHKIKPFRPY